MELAMILTPGELAMVRATVMNALIAAESGDACEVMTLRAIQIADRLAEVTPVDLMERQLTGLQNEIENLYETMNRWGKNRLKAEDYLQMMELIRASKAWRNPR